MPDPDQISTHFARSEFACKCRCGFDTVDIGLLAVLETIRAHFDAPVMVMSGCRCASHNADRGGVEDSQHLIGRAADISVAGIEARLVQDYIDQAFPDSLGMGRYAIWTHIDSRKAWARW